MRQTLSALADFAVNYHGHEEVAVEVIMRLKILEIEKAIDYLLAGVDRAWVMDTKAQSATIFRRDELLQTIKADGSISDSLLPGLILPLAIWFRKTP